MFPALRDWHVGISLQPRLTALCIFIWHAPEFLRGFLFAPLSLSVGACLDVLSLVLCGTYTTGVADV